MAVVLAGQGRLLALARSSPGSLVSCNFYKHQLIQLNATCPSGSGLIPLILLPEHLLGEELRADIGELVNQSLYVVQDVHNLRSSLA